MEEGSSDEYESDEDDVSQAPQAIGKPVVAVGMNPFSQNKQYFNLKRRSWN